MSAHRSQPTLRVHTACRQTIRTHRSQDPPVAAPHDFDRPYSACAGSSSPRPLLKSVPSQSVAWFLSAVHQTRIWTGVPVGHPLNTKGKRPRKRSRIGNLTFAAAMMILVDYARDHTGNPLWRSRICLRSTTGKALYSNDRIDMDTGQSATCPYR